MKHFINPDDASFVCSIPKLLHPYLERYFCVIQHNNYDKQEALAFLRMVSRKDRKLEYAFRQKEKGIKNKECAYLCAIGVRWFQKLYAEYKMAGTLPRLNWERRPKTCLNDGQKALIAKAMQESQMQGAVHLRLYIKKHYGENIAHNKIHAYLLKQGIAMEDKEKKKQRIYRLYARGLCVKISC